MRLNLISFATAAIALFSSGSVDCRGPSSLVVSVIRRCHLVAPSSQNRAPRAQRFRRIRGVTTMLIVSALTLLPSAGLASPPDPTWLDGIYDGADFDNVVSLVTDTPISSDEVSYQLQIPRGSSLDVLGLGVSTREGTVRLQPPRGPPGVFVSCGKWLRCHSHPRSHSPLNRDCVPTAPDRSVASVASALRGFPEGGVRVWQITSGSSGRFRHGNRRSPAGRVPPECASVAFDIRSGQILSARSICLSGGRQWLWRA